MKKDNGKHSNHRRATALESDTKDRILELASENTQLQAELLTERLISEQYKTSAENYKKAWESEKFISKALSVQADGFRKSRNRVAVRCLSVGAILGLVLGVILGKGVF